MSSKNRILEYLEYKGISKNKFYRETGLSNGFLDKTNNIGSDKLKIIISIYKDLNLKWIVTGEGEMLLKNAEEKEYIKKPERNNNNNCEDCSSKDKLIEVLQATISSQKQTIETQGELISQLKKNNATEPESKKDRLRG